MKIGRMAEEQSAPSWAFESEDLSEFLDENFMNSEDIERLSSLPIDDLTEAQVVDEREFIEQCSSTKGCYYLNSEWSDGVKSSLREYATACGMDLSMLKEVRPEYLESINVVSSEEKSIERRAKSHDPFNIDTTGDMTHMEASNWEDIHKQGELSQKPTLDGGIVPLRGGEDYYANSDPKTARGQNSITDPDAIGSLASSEEEDTGARLRRENEERSNSQETKHKEWQDEKVASMEGSDIIPQGTVFPTEVLNAQPGLDSDKIHMGVYSDFDPKDMPEKTDGERLAELNEERRQEIQGAPKEYHTFKPESHQARSISDTFAEALKKNIKF